MQEFNDLQMRLFQYKDEKFRDFQASLCPSVSKGSIIGIRTPILKKTAKEMLRTDTANTFLRQIPHTYFEENQLHAFILCELKIYEEALQRTKEFLPFVDNWATCDQLRPKSFDKNTDKLINEIYRWIDSNKTYTVRFGVGMLMKYYSDKEFKSEYLDAVSNIKSEEYYVNMMLAWYFATELAKQYEATIPYFINKKLPRWVHNKAISKAIDSFRVTEEHKCFLKTLRY